MSLLFLSNHHSCFPQVNVATERQTASVAFSRSFTVGGVITAALERGAEDRGVQLFLTTNQAKNGATAEEDEVLVFYYFDTNKY